MPTPSFLSHIVPHPPKPPKPSTSKAGRNLKVAIPTAIILLAIVAGSVMWKMEIFVVLAGLALSYALWEAAGAFLVKQIRLPLLALLAINIAQIATTWFAGLAWGIVAGLICWPLLTSAVFISQGRKTTWKNVLTSLAVNVWITWLGCCAVALAHMDRGALMIALLVLMPVANDVGGWAAGVMFGKHPLAPKISPKKSWEGLAGSLSLSVLVSWLFVGCVLQLSWAIITAVSLTAVVCSTGGDLIESVLKRKLGVKDMGSIFPGHGGMLDRLDSILMWAPLCYLIMVIA
ncbi:phosphatidate cytidylyltransferase [Actinotignum urinale]|uniref:phosphatidate cytidylyltransferase n=1 Tax=Actinotignum urinale TaxID=190146 RepID=UPI000C802488